MSESAAFSPEAAAFSPEAAVDVSLLLGLSEVEDCSAGVISVPRMAAARSVQKECKK